MIARSLKQAKTGPWIPGKGCDPEIEIVTNEPNPNFYPFNGVGIDVRNDYIRTFCENDARNRKFCTFACPNGVKMMFNGHTIPARKMKLKCRCPRVNGVKTCGWSYKRNLLTAGLDAYIYWRHTLVQFCKTPRAKLGGSTT